MSFTIRLRRAEQTLIERTSARTAQRLVIKPSDSEEEDLMRLSLPWQEWLRHHFPFVTRHPFAPHHINLWEWIAALSPGIYPRPRVEVWGRGGAKSATAELGCVYVGARLNRRFCLYVSGTQEQADKHVQSIATLFEHMGVSRAVNKYGSSKGWRRDQLRTAGGFSVAGYGLDSGLRGVKLDDVRPDMIVLDDVDDQDDSPKIVEGKLAAITSSILPTGSADCAVLVVQNKVHDESIVSQLTDGRADFLHDREPPQIVPAVRGLEVSSEDQGDGSKAYKITAGTATWEGQDLATCERQINTWGLTAFKREAQHDVEGAAGFFFDHKAFRIVSKEEVPAVLTYCRAWDLAATEGGGDYTSGVLMGKATNEVLYVLDVIRGQWGSDRVRAMILSTAAQDRVTYGRVQLRIPKDPGQAGTDQSVQLGTLLRDYQPRFVPPSGGKAVRARGWQEKVNSGNACLLAAEWNRVFTEEHRKFREDETHDMDDQVDAASDSCNQLTVRRIIRAA